MSPAYHLLGKAMNGEALNENQVRQIVGVIRKDERLKERERIIKLLEQRYAENVDHCEWGTHVFLDNAIDIIKGEQK